MDIRFDIADATLRSFADALSRPPANDLERDGIIKRFEYSFEALWKVGKRVLNDAGVSSTSPRSVIRDLAQNGFLDDAREWMGYLEARNYTTHTYNESVAKWVFGQCEPFLQAAETLLARLKKDQVQ